MHLKVYFNDKPLFLCDAVTSEIERYVHHDDAIFIDEFSKPAVKSMIVAMQSEKIHAGILFHTDLEELKKAFWKKFTVIQAAGELSLMNISRYYLFSAGVNGTFPKESLTLANRWNSVP